MASFVGYYRVSTAGQGRSGLGLEAQRVAVLNYVNSVGGVLIDEVEEIESGKFSDRVKLHEALVNCRRTKSTLVIAKLDRLSRSVLFISQLIASKVEFVAADMPAANKLTIHIIAAMAEYERDAISQRTKDALKAAKARGVVLGNPSLAEAAKDAVRRKRAIADSFALGVYPHIQQIRRHGIHSLSRTAAILESSGVRTSYGGRWWATSVANVIRRAESLSKEGATPKVMLDEKSTNDKTASH